MVFIGCLDIWAVYFFKNFRDDGYVVIDILYMYVNSNI